MTAKKLGRIDFCKKENIPFPVPPGFPEAISIL